MTNKSLIDAIQKFQMGLVSRNFMAKVLTTARNSGNDPYDIYTSLVNRIYPSMSGSFDFEPKHGKKEGIRTVFEFNDETNEVKPREDF